MESSLLEIATFPLLIVISDRECGRNTCMSIKQVITKPRGRSGSADSAS
jgi:hypothetical protein